MSSTKEVRVGSSLWFCKKSNTAYVSKMENGKRYFVSNVNRDFLSDDYSAIKNGEYFFITDIKILRAQGLTTLLKLSREKDRKEFIIRWKDLTHFCTK